MLLLRRCSDLAFGWNKEQEPTTENQKPKTETGRELASDK
jgi:hypothetical protein